jgi:phosphoglycerate dehydrogenase-like enzyme
MKQVVAAFFNSDHFVGSRTMIDHVYGEGRREWLASVVKLYPTCVTHANFAEHAGNLADLEVIFSTWGMPALTRADLERLPSLRAVFYAAGTVKGFARPFLERKITVCSAWGANAVSVAEFCLAQILLACKGYFANTRDCRTPERNRAGVAALGPGAYGETIAIIVAGQIGRCLISLLRPFRVNVLVVDPYLSEAEAAALNVRKVTLEQAFQDAIVVSNHLPNLPSLQKVLGRRLFELMRQGATFVNTGRGAQVDEMGLVAVLRQRPDLLALLDVSDPEPPPADSPFYALPNVQLSSHMAGAHGNEVLRMADFMMEEFQRWQAGAPLRYAVTLDMLERMA